MSNDPSHRGGDSVGSGGGQSLGDGGDATTNTQQPNLVLTPQQLREQRLARFGGGGGKDRSATRRHPQPQLKDPPQSPSASTTTNATEKNLKSPPSYTTSNNNNNNNSSSNKSIDTSPIPPSTKKKPPPPPAPPPSPTITATATATATAATSTFTPIKGNGSNNFERYLNTNNNNNNNNYNNNDKTVDAYTATDREVVTTFADLHADADLEDENFQAAIALSMGLPVPPSKFGAGSLDIDPLPLLEHVQEGEAANSNSLLAVAAMVVATTPTAPSTPMQIEEEDNDVVMENDDRKPAAIEKPTPTNSPSRILRSDPQHFSGRVRTWYETASPFNILDFHDCMWDKVVTTENDQKRWLAQGILFKDEHDRNSSTKTSATRPTMDDNPSSLLAAIISGPGVWCLTQQHGGPCGVLASIQAELLRILLFGPRTVHPLSMISIDFPINLSNEFTNAPPDMSRQKMRQVLALSMGIILARCSLMPSATLQDDDNTADSGLKNNSSKDNNDPAVNLPRPEPTVRLVLPKNGLWDTTNCLEWQHLEPWNSRNGGGGLSEHLLTYTVSLNKNPSTGSAVKRQKRSSSDGQELNDECNISDNDIDIDHTCKELAHATAQFLLETNSLNWFQRPGGVLLMVMSIAASRGIPKTHGDMDDLTAKLTSNFGHCSQELINLLLTGQAVSNVFDHTLKPSGELVCRGIQSQPSIGYLTQLEAMRYLEVGGFYKTPRFPVWVIGSTSHFTVMFGDASALKESASDALLAKVRRAFKRMDGGAEFNGFIQTNQLGDFLKSLSLNSISEHEVQTLAAFMDRYGAGIILWEDLWKRTSRLLTGASLESILDGTDEANNNSSIIINAAMSVDINQASSNPLPAGAATNDAPLSDEELARKMQAEWNDETIDLTGSSLADVFDSVSTVSTINAAGTIPSAAPAEKFGSTFQLYHYNGLRGGNFKAFRVTRLSADEAIGASIPLGGSNQASHNMGGFGGELDAVLRTKWPSCQIDWIGSPPSID